MFFMSGIKEQELLMGRLYGGCAIFINKTLGYNSIFVETETTRVCPTIIFICVYMPNDINSNIYEYNEVLSSMHMLQSLYNPNFIICGGDWNADLTRKTSHFTKSLVRFCEGLTCMHSVSNIQHFT